MIVYSPAVESAIARRAEREGLQLHLASYGGSGTVFTVEFLDRQKRCLCPVWHALLNHYAVPLELGVPRLVIMADPPTAYASVRRRNIQENVTRHLHGGQYGRDQIDGMVEFFDRWTIAEPLVFCKYESLYEHLGEIGAALGVSFKNFPKQNPRRSSPPDSIDPRLLALRSRFDALPDFFTTAAPRKQS